MNLKKIIKEEIDNFDFDWAKSIPTNPFDFYFNKGYNSVGIITHSDEDTSKLLSTLHSMGYDWHSSVPDRLYLNDVDSIIWVTKFGNKINLQFSDIDFLDDMSDDDIVIDNPFF